MHANAIGIIAGRGGNKRLPGKNMMMIAGKPLIVYVIEAARQSMLLERVLVTTDDEEISSVSKKAGAEIIKRPANLALDRSPIDDAYRHVLVTLDERENYKPEIIVAMQANIPVRKEKEIDEIIYKLESNPWASSITTGRRIMDRPEWMKSIKDQKTLEIAPYMNSISIFRKQDLPELFILDGAVIACRRRTLLEADASERVHAYLGDRVVIHVHEACYSHEIDDPEDLDLAEYYLSHRVQTNFTIK